MPDLELLLQQAQEDDPERKLDAVSQLSAFHDPRAFDVVLKVMLQELQNDWYDDILLEAILTLGDIGDPRAKSHLRTLLEADDDNSPAKEKAAQALVKLGDVDYLFQLMNHKNEWVRASVLFGLGMTPAYRQHAEAMSNICIKALADSSAEVQAVAIILLEALGEKRAIPDLQKLINSAELIETGQTVGKMAYKAIQTIEKS
jgi:HEAT repeat protein